MKVLVQDKNFLIFFNLRIIYISNIKNKNTSMKLIEEYAEFFNMTPSALLFLFKNQFVNKNLIIGQSRPVKDHFVTYKTITSDC